MTGKQRNDDLALNGMEYRLLNRIRNAGENGVLPEDLHMTYEKVAYESAKKRRLVRHGFQRENGTGRFALHLSSRGFRAMEAADAEAVESETV